jgi:hypothetical protein
VEDATASVDGAVDVDAASAVEAAAVSVGAGALVISTVDVVVCAVVSTG